MIVSFLVGPSSWADSVFMSTSVKASVDRLKHQVPCYLRAYPPWPYKSTLLVWPCLKIPSFPLVSVLWECDLGQSSWSLGNLTENQGDAPISGCTFLHQDGFSSAAETQKHSKSSHVAMLCLQGWVAPTNTWFYLCLLGKVAVVLNLYCQLGGI